MEIKRLWILMLVAILTPASHLQGKVSAPVLPTKLSSEASKVFLNQMRNAMSGVRTLQMNLQQKRVLSVFKDSLTSEGRMFFQTPDLLRWETTAPYKTLIIYNHGQTGKYTFENGQWRKLDFGAVDIISEIMSNIIGWTRGRFEEAHEDYDIDIYEKYIVTLTPKNTAMKKMLSMIDLVVEPEKFHITQVTLKETKGDYVEITFRDIKENQPLPKDVFNIQQPSS